MVDKMLLWLSILRYVVAQASVTIPVGVVGTAPPLPFLAAPQPPAPSYMVDNTLNQYGVAPDHGTLTTPLGKRASNYWLENVAHGVMPLAPSGYKFFRNVKDYGAVGDGSTDDTVAINKAISDGNRCGADCGSTSVLGALVYFPAGTYLISTPIVQLFYTQFIGDATNRPTIKGSSTFSGIALIDTDFYIPGGNGAEWYINQNNFFRQIRNINLDMRGMGRGNSQGDQSYVPTGIHWQVAQGTSIQNVDITMDVSDSTGPATGVGIFTENGSGGFMSDISIVGGHYGMQIGSQQFTVRNIQFTSCLTAINHIWNWGFVWQQIYVLSCYVALNCTQFAGPLSQGTGSISVIDSHFNGVPYAITVSNPMPRPNVVLDNLLVENSQSIVLVDGGATILPGSSGAVYVNSWAMGKQYRSTDGTGSYQTGYLDQYPNKPQPLLDSSGRYYVRSKPQYETVSSVVVATANGVDNTMNGDQTNAINQLLVNNIGRVIFFPAGIYLISGTVYIPPGSVIVGEGWSQFMAQGSYFSDETNPKPLVQVGVPGDHGSVEISDILFTTRGSTAGCIFVEWNIAQGQQGAAAMWDSHFRIGGAAGSDLQLAKCPTKQSTVNTDCKAGSMMLHVTPSGQGYFENVWAWVADHDLDNSGNAAATEGMDGVPKNVDTQVSIYNARGILIESRGPSWFIGTASEHSTLYQYQISAASQIYMGHLQTETAYYQPNPVAPQPWKSDSSHFANDPTFSDCSEDFCKAGWAMRVLNSSDILLYSAGFYSFFQNNDVTCVHQENCQQQVLETNYVSDMWLYNLFTIGTVQIATPRGGIPPIFFNDSNQSGYTSETAVWIPLSGAGAGDIGQPLNQSSAGSGDVYIDPTVYTEPDPKTIACYPPCTIILPPITLPTLTTITIPPYTTSLEVGWTTTDTITTNGVTSISTYYTAITESTVLTPPPVTTSILPVSNIFFNVTTPVTFTPTISILPPTFTISDDPNPLSSSGVSHSPVYRTITPPPWPFYYPQPTTTTSSTTNAAIVPIITWRPGPPGPICRSGCGSGCKIFCTCYFCPGGSFGLNIGPPGPPGRPPPGPSDFDDPSDPNNESKTSSTTCTASTFSSCRTECVAASPTSSCQTTCSPVVGCDTTGTQIASTITPAPVYSFIDEEWTDAAATDGLDDIADSMWSSFSSNGELDLATTTSPSSTSTMPPAPTDTTIVHNDPSTQDECFGPPNYVGFVFDDYVFVTTAFCNQNYILEPSNNDGFYWEYDATAYRVYAQIFWAPNQSGCDPKAEWHSSSSDTNSPDYVDCRNAFLGPLDCKGEPAQDDSTTSYGGTYVFKTPASGCVQLELYAISSAVQKRGHSSFLASNGSALGHYEKTVWVNPNATTNAGRPSMYYNNTTATVKHRRRTMRSDVDWLQALNGL